MGRRRKDGNPLGLERRVYWHHGQFIYRHRDGHAALGKYFPQQLVDDPSLIADYRNNRSARVRANRELSLLSAMFTWLIEKGDCPGLNVNPVLLIKRNPEKAKERYVEDHEYQMVYSVAVRPVCMAMVLAYRTLQRPEDLLKLGPQNIRTKTVAGVATKVLSLIQGKRGRAVDIAITPDIEDALGMLTDGNVQSLARTLIHRRTDKGFAGYTVDGIGSMIRRYCEKMRP